MPTMLFSHASWAALADRLLPRRKRLAQLRARWGQPGTRGAVSASRYFDLTRSDDPARHVDDKTWADLEFPELFSRMDTTVTALGSQVLYRQLRTRVDDAGVLESRHAICERLRQDSTLREGIQMQLSRMDRDSGSAVSRYLFGTLPENGKYHWLLQAWAVVSIAVIVLALPLSLPAWLFVPVLFANFVVALANMAGVRWKMEALTSCLILADVAERLATMRCDVPRLPQLSALAAEQQPRSAFKRRLRGLRVMLGFDAAKVPVAAELASLVKSLLLIEVLVCDRAIRRFAQVRDKLAATFALVGELDAAIAVASWLEQVGVHCRPQLAEDGRLVIIDGAHPLIIDGVRNSIESERGSVLVTGSNMAGKTTFIKMVGINMLLGRTLGACVASAATVPRGLVMASIHNRHSVGSGKSHYFAEIDAIRTFLERAQTPGSHLFLIDEPLSGTNTVERIAIARAVLETLGHHAHVFATTHDVELQTLLGDSFGLCHFQENPDVEGFFDYRLKPGATRERNAIRLLERVGFPQDIVKRAMGYAAAGIRPGVDVRDAGTGTSSAHATPWQAGS